MIAFVQKTPVEQEQDEQDENKVDDHQEEDIFDFTVYAIKGNSGVAFDCSAINGQVHLLQLESN